MKKKILTLTFTLILLIGLVAAVGMNASAAAEPYKAFNRNGYVSTPDNLWNYAAQAYNGDTIALSGNITYDDKYDDEPYVLPFASDGDIVLDLNGYTIDITSRADSLIELDYGSTRLHIINSKAATTESKIIMRTKLGDASIVDLSNKNCSVYVYDGVELALGKEGDQAEAYRQTHVIKATAFSEIALYGGTVTNNIANGNGIKLISTNSVAFNNSTVILHGYAKIKANTCCIHLNDAFDYPTFRIGEATLDAGNNSLAISHYIGTAQQEVDNKKISDFLYDSGYGAYNLTAAEGGGRLENYIISSSTLIDNLTACDIKFKHTGALYSCTHSYSSIINYPGGHYMSCDYCGKFNTIESHTSVDVKGATCTQGGYSKAGYDCACGYLTATVVPALGHDFYTVKAKEPSCTESGTTSDYQKCTRCASVFTMGGDAFGGAKWAAIYKKALGHDMKAVAAVAATCTKDGNIAHYDCSRCDHKSSDAEGKDAITNVVVAKKAHSYKTVTTKATLTKNGKVDNKCSVCGNVKSTTTVYYPKTIKLEYTSTIYNGKTKKPSVTVKDSKGNKISKDYYTVKYASGRKSTGKYSVTITFKGNYSGTKTLYFNILPSKTSKITPTCSTTEIKASWKKVTGASGYKVELLNSKGKVVKKVTTTKTSYTFKKLTKVTTYKIRVTAYKTIDKKAAYSTVSTTIKTSTAPAKVTLSKVTAGSKSAAVSWKTVSGASGYQVQYSTSSKFKSAKTATVSKGSSKKTTIKKLTKGKKYYFKVRAYKTVDGKKVCGAWSSVKTVKVK